MKEGWEKGKPFMEESKGSKNSESKEISVEAEN